MSNAYSGFEGEAYRQSLLQGRRFTGWDKAMRVKQFSGVGRTSILQHPELPEIPGRRASTAAAVSRHDPSRFPRAGEFTNNGVGEKSFNILNGESTPTHWRLLPQFGAHASRVPVHTLEAKDTRASLLKDEDSLFRPPTSRTAGVTKGVDPGSSYTTAHGAFSPAGFRSPVPRETVASKAAEYTSWQMLKRDKTKHVRAAHEPTTRATAPMLSSQRYGWEVNVWEAQRRSAAGGGGGSGDVPGGTIRHPRVACRETRNAHSLLVGPRHVHGYSGQGGC